MSITIKLPTPLRRHTQQQKNILVEAQTVGAALSVLCEQFPAMQGSLFAEDGNLKPFVRVFVGAQDIADLQGLETPMPDGTVISIVPPVAGA